MPNDAFYLRYTTAFDLNLPAVSINCIVPGSPGIYELKPKQLCRQIFSNLTCDAEWFARDGVILYRECLRFFQDRSDALNINDHKEPLFAVSMLSG